VGIDGDKVFCAGAFQGAGNCLGRNGLARQILAVLAGIDEIGHDCSDLLDVEVVQGVHGKDVFDEIRVGVLAVGHVEDEDDLFSLEDFFLALDDDAGAEFAVGKFAAFHHDEFGAQMLGNVLPESVSYNNHSHTRLEE